jgi:FAD/FMN-containing dehydrogenase
VSDQTAVQRQLAAKLGVDEIIPRERWEPDATEDVCRAPLGQPCAWVRPRTTAAVAAVVRVARAERVPVVTIGRRTGYWRPLRFDGAIVLETLGLAELEPFVPEDRTLWCGAGASVRAVDDTLRAAGHVLPAYPDSYGDTPIGAMVATGFCSGIGMGQANVDALVTGLELVLGTGEVVRTGAAASLGGPAFLRIGLPDPTGLWIAAEGALGIVTRVCVRARPHAHRSQLRVHVDAPLATVLALAHALRVPGLLETFRVVDPGVGERPRVTVDLVVHSALGRAELDGRVAWVLAQIGEHLPEAGAIDRIDEGPGEAVIQRFWGPSGQLWPEIRKGRLAPVDVNLRYADAAAALRVADRVVAAHAGLPWLHRRRALYFAPDFVNFGFHGALDPASSDDAMARAFVAAGVAALGRLAVIPYRYGRVWGPTLAGRLDPGYRRLMAGLRDVCDPDNLLNPGVSVFAPAPARPEPSPLIRALGQARPDLPEALVEFDALARAGGQPSFEEYSARIGDDLAAWRQTLYFDVAEPGQEQAARAGLLASATELGFVLPSPFRAWLDREGAVGPEVMQVVLGYDAAPQTEQSRLKYYLVFHGPADRRLEALRASLGAPPLPAALPPASIYIVGLDFTRAGLHDFKLYVRLDASRLPSVVRNLRAFAGLVRGSRYVVFQRCLMTGGQQVYFHATRSEVVEAELDGRRDEAPVAELVGQIERMNAALAGARLRPWIISFAWRAGQLLRSPANVYFHRG